MLEYLITFWIVGSVACAIAGSYREIGGAWGFAAGALLSPILGMGVVLATAGKRQIELLEEIADLLSEEPEEEEPED